jgi:hypothetical protein
MKAYGTRGLGFILAIVLSGVLEPVAAWAQTSQTPPASQSPAETQSNPTPQPNAASPASTSSDQSSTPDADQQPTERQSQQDKASQQMINAAPESGAQLPESPDTIRARQEAAQRSQQTTPTTQPSGTAAAEEAHPVGAVASRPAGAAIAPASQKRVRSFLIKLGIVAGVGAAAGTVYGLSRASGPKPPGAK